MNRLLSWFCKIFLKPIINILLIKEVKGLENIPKGNFILAANHQSHLDQICTGYVAVPRRFHMIGQIDRYNEKLLTRILRDLAYFIAEVIPLDRRSEESKKEVIEEAIRILKRGDVLIIYPEGTRTRSGEMGRGKPGVAKIFLETRIPILPVGIRGTFELMPPGRVFPKIKRIVKINVGKPLYFKEEFERAKKISPSSPEYKEILEDITNKIMAEIKNLVNL